MITIKEYAESRNKTVQAVYQQLQRDKNKSRLKGHTTKKGRTTFIDEVAISILDESKNDSLFISDQKDRLLAEQLKKQVEELKNENDQLKNKIILLQDNYTIKTEQLAEALIENKEKTLLLEQQTNLKNELQKAQAELEEEKNKGFFSRLFRK